jgi:putative spermidine/putrescine transport system permease protein
MEAYQIRRRHRTQYRDNGGVSLRVVNALIFAFLLAPLAILALTSFTAGEVVTFPPREYSLRWYEKIFRHLQDDPELRPGLLQSFWLSIKVAAIAAGAATLAGTLAAYGLYRHRFRFMTVLRQLFLVPLVFPQLVTGVALLLWFSQLGRIDPLYRLLLGHTIITLPYVILTVGASLETMGLELEEAALGLGANRVQVFLRITLPLISHGIIAGAIFALIISFNTFTISYFLYSGEAMPVPMWMFGYMAYFLDPTLAAISVFLVALTLIVLIALDQLVGLRRLMMR